MRSYNPDTKKGRLLPKGTTKDPEYPACTIWLTGLPSSGKTTIAKRLKKELDLRGYTALHLDADQIRKGLNADLGFSEKDRIENVRRVAQVCRFLNRNKILVIASFICPTNAMRRMIRKIILHMELVYVKCGRDTCEKRDVKGMYRKARQGIIPQFTGISAPFEVPIRPDVVVDAENSSVDCCVTAILKKLTL